MYDRGLDTTSHEQQSDANFSPRWDRNSAFQVGQWQISFFFAFVCVNRDEGLDTT
jgi:hypothetical protein